MNLKSKITKIHYEKNSKSILLPLLEFFSFFYSKITAFRNYLYDKMQRQDMKFYSTYRTGDLMTRVTGDLDAVRHNIAWVIRAIVESIVLYSAVAIYFLILNWKLALAILFISPFILLIIVKFKILLM